MPGLSENICMADYIWKFLELGVITRALSENFNMVAVRSHRGAIYCMVSDVDEASVSYIDEIPLRSRRQNARKIPVVGPNPNAELFNRWYVR
jgi:hypothetical protein